jgi:hypothetical protein
MESIQNMRTCGYRVILKTDDILYPYDNSMKTARFISGHSLSIQSVGHFKGLLVIYLYKCIEMGETFDPFEIIQNRIPAGQGAFIQGLLVIVYGSKRKQ